MEGLITRINYICSHYCGNSTNKFASELGITQQSVDKYVKGQTRIPASFLIAILNTYPQVSAEWLMRGTGSIFISDTPTEFNNVGGHNNAFQVQGDMNNGNEELLSHLIEENKFLRNQNEKLTNKILGL